MVSLQPPLPAFRLNGESIGIDMLVAQHGHQNVDPELRKRIELEAEYLQKGYIDLSGEVKGIELFEISDDESQVEDQVLKADAGVQPTSQKPVSTSCSSPICCEYRTIELQEPRGEMRIHTLPAKIRIGSNVELKDGSFIRINSIKQLCLNHGARIVLKGKKFLRTRNLLGYLHCRLNELVMISADEQVECDQLLRGRKIILTNANFPNHRLRVGSDRLTEQLGRLVCRWYMETNGTTSLHVRPENRKPGGTGLIRRLREDEADAMFRVRERILKKPYVTTRECSSNDSEEQQKDYKYTFGDAFCGAGGMSCGASQAKFINSWGFDHDTDAIATFRKRYPEAQAFHLSADQFIALPGDYHVDVMHLSPPCQPHSPAHTTPGQFDEDNEASSLCICDCLKKVKPRFATLEQTFGLTHRPVWFRAVINQFTSAGYSVRWSILPCVKYGVPQTRQRLIIMASCPGEQPPKFPEPTHWYPKPPPEPTRLKPARTLGDAIGNLQPGISAHNPNDPALRFPDNMRLDTKNVMNLPFMRTIMAGGNHNGVHPSGLRRFTLREIACIQTFPENYDFVGGTTNVKRQIGNAVPPRMGKILMREVLRVLEESDRKDAEESSETPPLSQFIDIDELDDSDTDSFMDMWGTENPLFETAAPQFIDIDEWDSSDSELPITGRTPAKTPSRESVPPPPQFIDIDEWVDSDVEVTGERPAEKPLQQSSRSFRTPYSCTSSSSPSPGHLRNVVDLDTPGSSPAPTSPRPSQQSSPQRHNPHSEPPPPSSPSGFRTRLPSSQPNSRSATGDIGATSIGDRSASLPLQPDPPCRKRRVLTSLDARELQFAGDTPSSSAFPSGFQPDSREPARQRKRAKVVVTVDDHITDSEEDTAVMRKGFAHVVID